MASFNIHQDADKENPTKQMISHKEKLKPMTQKQPLAEIGGIRVGGLQNLNSLKPKINNNKPRAPLGEKVVGWREKEYTKVGDENAAVTESKISSAVKPVVEQFKSFSVYEDQSDVKQPQNAQKKNVANLAKKDNVNIKEPLSVEYDSMHKEFSIQDNYALDHTPMSVTDILSPMSVDRSLLSVSEQSDESNTVEIANISKQIAGDVGLKDPSKKLPRNDRERFYQVPEYQPSILEYFRESEKRHRPKPHYMRRQTDINHSMRTILVDWLVEVSEEYNLETETLYLAVSYIDRFLSQMAVVRSKLQLVGTAAMYIASKYEEIYPPDVGEFVFITDDTYNKAQVLRMEQIILKILAFDLCTPTAYVFVNMYAVNCGLRDQLKFLTLYICELSLLEADPYLRYLPSLISAASLALARYILGFPIWTAELEEVTSYKLDELKKLILRLCQTHNDAITLSQQAVREKYKSEKYKQVSTIEPVELDETFLNDVTHKYNEACLQAQKKKEMDAALYAASKANLFFK